MHLPFLALLTFVLLASALDNLYLRDEVFQRRAPIAASSDFEVWCNICFIISTLKQRTGYSPLSAVLYVREMSCCQFLPQRLYTVPLSEERLAWMVPLEPMGSQLNEEHSAKNNTTILRQIDSLG